jgi:hypothetical protein
MNEKLKQLLISIVTIIAGDSVFIGQVRHYISIFGGVLIGHRLANEQNVGQLTSVLEQILLSPDFWVGVTLNLWTLAASWVDKLTRKKERAIEREVTGDSVRLDPASVAEEKLSGVSESGKGSEPKPGGG